MELHFDLPENPCRDECWVCPQRSLPLIRALYTFYIGIPARETRLVRTCKTSACVNPWHHQFRYAPRKIVVNTTNLQDMRDLYETVAKDVDHERNRKFPNGWSTPPVQLLAALEEDYSPDELNLAVKMFGTCEEWNAWNLNLQNASPVIEVVHADAP